GLPQGKTHSVEQSNLNACEFDPSSSQHSPESKNPTQ
ncbi:hypothetical protein A2U01_0095364, partial [Trifolium medium]|nr:hypothetical protein [Trifolium medium]